MPQEGAAPAGAGDSHAGAHAQMGHDDLAHEATIHANPPAAKPPGYDGLLATATPASAPAAETPDDVFQEAFQDYKPATRPNTQYKFPTARELDQWLPIALPVVALIWLTWETLSTEASTPGWVGPLRLVLFLGLFAGLVWPLTAWAVRRAATDLKFELPPVPRRRVLAAFALPFALTFILWMTLESINGLVIGSVVGLVLGLAAVWLFMRITPDEAPKTLGFSGSAFVAAIVISAGFLAGVNAIALAAAKDSKSPTTLAMSPIVPGLPWVEPAPPDVQPRPKKPLNPTPSSPTEAVANSGNPGTDSTGTTPTDPFGSGSPTSPTTTGPAVAVGPDAVLPNQKLTHPERATSPSTPDATGTPPPTDPAADPTGTKPPAAAPRTGSILFNDDPSQTSRRPPAAAATANPPVTSAGTPGATVTAPNPVGTGPIAPPAPSPSETVQTGRGAEPPPTPAPAAAGAGQPDAFITAISAAQSPLVAEVAPVPTANNLVAMAPPLTPSAAVLLLEAAPGVEKQEFLEVWSLVGPQPKVRFQRPPFPVTPDRAYVVSPEGSWSARIVQFPALSIEVWSNDKGASSKLIPMQQQNGKPTLLGFLGEDRLLVWWESGMEAGLEPYDIKTGQHMRPTLLPDRSRTPGNGAASPDGRAFAVVTKDKDKARVSLYQLVGTSGVRQFVLPQLDAQWADPVAMAFSADGKRLAVLFEREGNAVLYDCHVAEGKTVGPVLLPAGTLPVAPVQQMGRANELNIGAAACPHPAAGRQMSWLADGTSLLVRGDVVLDADTGQVKGHLGAKGVLSEVVSGNTCLLEYRSESGELRLARVTLRDAAAAPQPAPGHTPATRPAAGAPGASAAPPRSLGTPAGTRMVPTAGPASRAR